MPSDIEQLDKLAKARNKLDLKSFSDLMADNIVYESQDALEPISGKATLIGYLSTRFKFIKSLDVSIDKGSFELAEIDLPTKENCLCLAFLTQGQIKAVWLPTFNEQSQIKRIDIITAYPDPKTARVLKVN